MTETALFRIVVAFLIFAVAWIAIGVIPLPKDAPPIKWVFYVLAALGLILYLWQYT
jgi:hypothetical protein